MNILYFILCIASYMPNVIINDHSIHRLYQYHNNPKIINIGLDNQLNLILETSRCNIESNIDKVSISSLDRLWITEDRIIITWEIVYNLQNNSIQCDVISELYDSDIKYIE